MKHGMTFLLAVAAAAALTGCPSPRTDYPSTITPIYAGTSLGALFVNNGSSWTSYSALAIGAGGGITGVVVSGSGSGARMYVSGPSGVLKSDGGAWASVLGSGSVTRLCASSVVYAIAASSLSMLNPDGKTWETSTVGAADAFYDGVKSYVVTSLFELDVFSGPGLIGGPGSTITGSTIMGVAANVTSVFEDQFGNVIAGTDTGASIFPVGGSSWVHILTGVSVTHVYADLYGRFFTTSATGLYTYDGTTTKQILSGAVNCVCVDGKGVIYAGTTTGLEISRDVGSTWTTELSGQNITAVATTAPLYSF